MTDQQDTDPDPGPLETRHYIGVTSYGRLALIAGPGRFDGPPKSLTLGDGIEVFPVSKAVHREWIGPEDEDFHGCDQDCCGDECDIGCTVAEEEPGPDAMRWAPADQRGIG